MKVITNISAVNTKVKKKINPLIDTTSGNAYALFIASPFSRALTDLPKRSYRTMSDNEIFIAALEDIVKYVEIQEALEVEVPLFTPRTLSIDLILKFVRGYKFDTPYRNLYSLIYDQLVAFVFKQDFNIDNIRLSTENRERMKELIKGK